MSSSAAALKKTPLNARHRASGGRMVEFAGWDMPVEYSGISDEHLAVRTRAGLFDVSHMGEIENRRPGRPCARPGAHEQRCIPAVGRAGAVLRAHDARRDVRR